MVFTFFVYQCTVWAREASWKIITCSACSEEREPLCQASYPGLCSPVMKAVCWSSAVNDRAIVGLFEHEKVRGKQNHIGRGRMTVLVHEPVGLVGTILGE